MPRLPKVVLARLGARSAPQPLAEAVDAQQRRENLTHPDANLLSAFAEKTLAEEERAQVLNHLSACAGCREIVALALPAEVQTEEPARATAPAGRGLWPFLRWGTLAAALGSVAIVVLLHRHPSRPPATLARATQPTIQSVPGPVLPAPSAAPTKKANAGVPGNAVRTESRVAREVQQLKTEPVTAAAGGTNKPLVPAESKSTPTLMAAAREPVSEVPLAPPAKGTAALDASGAPPQAARVRVESHTAGLSDAVARRQIKARVTLPSLRWTISTGGILQRSDDDGRTWTEISLAPSVKLSAVAAEGSEVWAGGTGGTLYHSSNSGNTWKRVDLRTAGAIVSIQMSDPQHLTAATETGEHWMSQDGGQTWRTNP